MKAKRWRILKQRDAICEEFEFDPDRIGPRDIAVRVHASAVSPGTETSIYTGADPDVLKPGAWCAYPFRPGYSGCGEVLNVGPDVKFFKKGDRVVGNMHHATHDIVQEDIGLAMFNPRVATSDAAFVRIIGITMTVLQVLRNDPLGSAGVWGQGMIGNFAAQLLNNAGFQTFAIDPVPARREIAQQCGLRHTLDPTDPKFHDTVMRLTGGEGFDVTVDTTGHAPTTITLPSFTRLGGQFLLMTHWRSQPVIDATPFIGSIFARALTVHGALEWAVGRERGSDWAAIHRDKYAKIQNLIADGDLKIAPLVSHRVRPEQCREVYEGLAFDKTKWWGAVVDWT